MYRTHTGSPAACGTLNALTEQGEEKQTYDPHDQRQNDDTEDDSPSDSPDS